MASSLFTQVAASYRPRRVAEIAYEQGSGASAAGYKAIYIPGEILAAGTLANGDVSLLTSANDAATKFGAGSFGAWYAAQIFRGGGLLCRVYGVGVTEPAGVAATQEYVFATAATSNGTYTVNVAGAVFTFSIESGYSVTQAGDALVAAFNLLDIDQKPPCTLVNAAGTVTATMNNKGAIANSAPSYQIITGDEPTGMTLTVGGCCFGIGGGAIVPGTLYPTLTTALANLTTVVTPCLVNVWDETPDGSTKPADLFLSHIKTKTDAEVGHRGRVMAATCKTAATIVSDIAALDDNDAERYAMGAMGISIATNSPGTWHPSAACYMAHAWGEVLDPAHPFDNVALPFMVAPPDSSDIDTNDEIDVLIEAGATALSYSKDRDRYLLIKGIGCRLFSGKVQPWAIVDSADWVRYNYIANLTATFPAGTKLAENGETNLDENCTTPAGVLDVWHTTIYDRNMIGILRNQDETWAASYAEINESFDDRVDVSGDFAVMNGLSVVASLLRQRGGILTQAAA
jgi:phage tail sheath gpL-like